MNVGNILIGAGMILCEPLDDNEDHHGTIAEISALTLQKYRMTTCFG